MDSEPQKRKSFEDQNDREYKIRCFISKLETSMELGKRVLNDIIRKKARLAVIDREIFDTHRQITNRLMCVRQWQLKIKAEQEYIANYSRLVSQLKRQKTAILASVSAPPANDESQATASSRAENECTQERDLGETVSKNIRIDIIDNELSDIDKQIAETRRSVQLAEVKLMDEQYTIADRRKHVGELKRQKTELLAFVNELSDKLQQTEARTTSVVATPPSANSKSGEHDDAA